MERLWNCPASAVLPSATRVLKVGRRGTDIHGHCQRVANVMPVMQSLLLVPAEVRPTCAGIDFQRIWGDLDQVRAEVAYALNARTDEVRELGVNIGRAYPDLGPDWVYGTVDLEGCRIDGVWAVPDLKTGFLEVDDPEENFQLAFGARVVSLRHDADEIDSRVINIRTDGSIYTQLGNFNRMSLDEWGDRFIEIVDGVAQAKVDYDRSGRADVSEGKWCRYCPALTACPAKTSMAKAMLPTLQEVSARLGSMTLEERGRAYEIAHDKAKPMLETILDSIKSMAVQEAIPLPNGKVLAPTYQKRENFVEERALELLRRLGAKQDDIDTLYVTKEIEVVKAVSVGAARKAAQKKGT
jgi:hypothetical protein